MRDDLGHGRGGAPGNADEANWPGRGLLPDLAACLRFYSRLPVPRLHGEGDIHAAPDFRTAPRMLPLAGLILALPAALTLLAARGLGLGPFLAAALALTVMVLVTGALHEDGLADLADGCGGATRERRLEIMRDSRLGSYGAIALAGTVAGGLAHVLVDPLSTTPLVGASAGISALMAAACRFVFQRPVVGYGDRPWQLPPRQPLESLPELLRNRTAAAFLAIWLGTNLLFGLVALPLGADNAAIAWDAHLGGFLAGFLLFPYLDAPSLRRR